MKHFLNPPPIFCLKYCPSFLENLYFLIALLILLQSCTTDQPLNDDIPVLKIDASAPQNKDADNSENDIAVFADSVRYIVLETSKASLLAKIDRVYYFEEFLFVLDGKQSKLLQFTDSGQFVRQIGSKGKGPGEYSRIHDFHLNEVTGHLQLLCDYKIVEFQLDGTFIKDHQLSKIYHSFLPFDENCWLFPYQGDFAAELLDYSSGQIVKKMLPPQADYHPDLIHPNRSVTYGAKPYFNEFWKNTIYTITEEGVIPYCTIDFGKQTVTEEVIHHNRHLKSFDFSDFLLENSYIYHISGFTESERFIFFRCAPGLHVVFDKVTSESMVANFFPDTLSKLYLSNFVESATFNTPFITHVLQPRMLRLGKEHLKSHSKDTNLLKIIDSIHEEDNPILVRYTLK